MCVCVKVFYNNVVIRAFCSRSRAAGSLSFHSITKCGVEIKLTIMPYTYTSYLVYCMYRIILCTIQLHHIIVAR